MNDELDAELEARLARAKEIVEREFYFEHRDDPKMWGDVYGVATIKPKRLDVIQSVRFDADTVTAVRERARAAGYTGVSDYLRMLAEQSIRPTGFRCDHMSITGGSDSAHLVSATGCCEMEPVYAATTC